jgi:hypothetical protein
MSDRSGRDQENTMDGLIAYFEKRQKRCQEQLVLAETPGFSLRQSVPGFPDADVTEQYRTSLRIAIDDYQRAIHYLHETGAQ